MKVAEKAAQWWVAMQGNPSRTEREAYVVWLRESPAHVAAVLRLRQLHAKLKCFRGWGPRRDHQESIGDLAISAE